MTEVSYFRGGKNNGQLIRALAGLTVVAAVVDATKNYDEYDFTQPTAIVLGSEASGLSDLWRCEIESVRLPMQGTVDSLNVSATAAVLLYEANRQRRRSG